ncbi:hypothetical protein P7C70_g6668, partial [Phenoliferia sp. Uapishka_3]
MSLLIINPNSTIPITDGLRTTLLPHCPPHLTLDFFTAPSPAPTGISNFVTSIQTAYICFEELLKMGAFEKYAGFLVCCFSDHPLQHMIREYLGPTSPIICIGMFEAGLSSALMTSRRFGILSTGFGPKPLLAKGVSAFLGASGSDRYAGGITSGIRIEELRTEDGEVRKEVERKMKEAAGKVAALGADCLVLGCAGMSGMEELVREGVRESGFGEVRVVDAAVVGMRFLAGMVTF